MKQGWEVKKFEDVIKLTSGDYLSVKDMVKGEYPVYGGNGIAGYHNQYNLSEETVIIGRVGALCGNVRYINSNIWLTDNAFKVSLRDVKIDFKLLAYYLDYLNLRRYARQTAQPVISNSSLKGIIIFIPSVFEQERIVRILDSAFAKIETLRANAEQNFKKAKELFQASLKQELTPKQGWDQKVLLDISTNLDNKRVPITKEDRSTGAYPYYGASGIVDYVDDYIFDDNLLLISEDGANLLARSTPIAFSVSGKIWVNNHAHVIKFSNIYTQKYIEHYFASIKIDEFVTGAAQPKLNQKALNSIRINIPVEISEQQAIVEKLDALSERCRAMEENYRQTVLACDDLKQALLRKAFNGEL